jgi:hypothetical protein
MIVEATRRRRRPRLLVHEKAAIANLAGLP